MNKPKLPMVRMVLYFPFAMLGMAVGLGLLIPPFTPFGFIVLFATGIPYARWMSKKLKADIEYVNRDHALNEGEPKPWETEEGQIEEELINIILNGSGRGKSND